MPSLALKANNRLFFLRFLKNAFPHREDLVDTYTSLVRPIVEYACPYGMLVDSIPAEGGGNHSNESFDYNLWVGTI